MNKQYYLKQRTIREISQMRKQMCTENRKKINSIKKNNLIKFNKTNYNQIKKLIK